jgi:transcription termination factor NusB
MSELINFSRKYQRELAIINLFQIIFYKSDFVFELLDDYFKNLLNRYIIDKVDIDLKIWNIVRYTDFSILNELEKSLLILFFLETLYSDLDAKIILSIYINLSIKYCRKNFNKLIPVFLDKIKNE